MLARVHEVLVAGASEQQRELLQVAQSIDKILVDIAGLAAEPMIAK